MTYDHFITIINIQATKLFIVTSATMGWVVSFQLPVCHSLKTKELSEVSQAILRCLIRLNKAPQVFHSNLKFHLIENCYPNLSCPLSPSIVYCVRWITQWRPPCLHLIIVL